MIIHLFVPEAEKQSIKDTESKDFRIINWFYKNKLGQTLFIIDTTEEQLIFFKLKYGNKNAWER